VLVQYTKALLVAEQVEVVLLVHEFAAELLVQQTEPVLLAWQLILNTFNFYLKIFIILFVILNYQIKTSVLKKVLAVHLIKLAVDHAILLL
jgi:hypothetical protein